jgi:shikimate kinase
MDKFSRIFLIGPNGAGKTSVGKELAVLLGWQFIDSDQLVEQQHQMSITEIFREFGESYFRCQEANLLKKISAQQNIVVATGGGSILVAQTRDLLMRQGTVCFLEVSITVQLDRLTLLNDRPLLPADINQRTAYLSNMHNSRWHLYKSTAGLRIDTDHLNAAQVALRLSSLLSEETCI